MNLNNLSIRESQLVGIILGLYEQHPKLGCKCNGCTFAQFIWHNFNSLVNPPNPIAELEEKDE